MDCQEYLKNGFFSGIILMAVFHGVLLAAVFLFHKKLNTTSNKFLALSILGICGIIGYEFFVWLALEEQIPIWVATLPIYIGTSIPVGILCFVLFLINPEHQLSKLEKLGFVMMGVEFFFHFTQMLLPMFMENLELIEWVEEYGFVFGWLVSVLAFMIFLPLALYHVLRYQRFLYDNYSTTHKKSLGWLQTFLMLIFVTSLLWCLSFIQYVLGYEQACDFTYNIVTICFILLLFSIGYFLVLEYSWFEIAPIKEESAENKTTSNKLSSNTIYYYKQLKQLLQDEKVYEDVNLTLDNLSERLQISSGYLSLIIKENEQKNFFEFINFYRVESVKQKLLDDDYKNYTIMGIATECGFNSKSTFYSVFKKFTGETPSAFKRQASLHSN